VADDAAVFLLDARQEARHIDEGDDRDVEGVAEADEARGLVGGVDVEHAGLHRGLVGDDADAVAADAPEADHDVRGVAGLDFEEVAEIHHRGDHLEHVVGLLGVDRHQGFEQRVGVDGAVALDLRRVFEVVGGQEAEQLLAQQNGVAVVLGDEVDHAGMDHVGFRPAQLLGRHRLAGNLLDHLRPGDEELGLAGLDDEVGERRAVGGAAAQGPQISEICGTAPDSSTLALNTLP
jgi:hypothetical protein